MKSINDIKQKFVNFFFNKIVGFEKKEAKVKYIKENEYIAITMDKIERLTRSHGRLRERVWSNCYFVFHDSESKPDQVYKRFMTDLKANMPYFFIRSYVYLVFINIDLKGQDSLFEKDQLEINTRDFKIWYFNSKYEIKQETRRSNLFGISLKNNEFIDDYMYIANPETELERMQAANSDAVDCVRAFTGDLVLLSQTSEMLNEVNKELNSNPRARILVEGPARSGKTIIAATLLGTYEKSKFLLMNYFFYKAIVDGFHALSGWSKEEIEELVSNPELDTLIELNQLLENPQKQFYQINRNLPYAIKECDFPKVNSDTQKWLLENISKIISNVADVEDILKSLPIFSLMIKIKDTLENDRTGTPFASIKSDLLDLQRQLRFTREEGVNIENVKGLQNKINILINEIMMNSKQKFFHHNINKDNSYGCWITRGNPTKSHMWSDNNQTDLIICDEVQRLGVIDEYRCYDKFNEIEQLIDNSKQSFFTGDNFQMLNEGYDKGIQEIEKILNNKNEHLVRYKLPEAVGVPAEVGLLMKGLTHPDVVEAQELFTGWSVEREFEIIFIDSDNNKLVELFSVDKSIRKHFAVPLDGLWLREENNKNELYKKIKISSLISKDIIPLTWHEKKRFAYSFPYFCNEEVMPNYSLSAYELISREVDSLYVHIPNFNFLEKINENLYIETWFRKHLYVLYTRPTLKLVVNIDSKYIFNKTKKIVDVLNNNGAKINADFF